MPTVVTSCSLPAPFLSFPGVPSATSWTVTWELEVVDAPDTWKGWTIGVSTAYGAEVVNSDLPDPVEVGGLIFEASTTLVVDDFMPIGATYTVSLTVTPTTPEGDRDTVLVNGATLSGGGTFLTVLPPQPANRARGGAYVRTEGTTDPINTVGFGIAVGSPALDTFFTEPVTMPNATVTVGASDPWRAWIYLELGYFLFDWASFAVSVSGADWTDEGPVDVIPVDESYDLTGIPHDGVSGPPYSLREFHYVGDFGSSLTTVTYSGVLVASSAVDPDTNPECTVPFSIRVRLPVNYVPPAGGIVHGHPIGSASGVVVAG